MYEITVKLDCEEYPTVKDVIDYINELGEDLHFYVTLNGEEIKWKPRTKAS